MEEDRLFNMVLVQLASHSEKNKAVSLHPITKINSRWMKNLIKKKKNNILKGLQENVRHFFFTLLR